MALGIVDHVWTAGELVAAVSIMHRATLGRPTGLGDSSG
jgi:hypothetical protein